MKTRKGFFLYSEKYERIKVETKRRAVVVRRHCEKCREPVTWLTIPEVAREASTTPEAVTAVLARQELHLRIEDRGEVYICSKSLEGLL